MASLISYFWLLGESHETHTSKVGVYRENFNIGNLAQNFFMVFFICWQYAISFLTEFNKLRKFSRYQSPADFLETS